MVYFLITRRSVSLLVFSYLILHVVATPRNREEPAGFASHKHIVGLLLTHLRSKLVKQVTVESHEELPMQHEDPYLQFLHRIIRLGVKFLPLLMVQGKRIKILSQTKP